MYRKCEKGLVHCLLPILARDGLGRSKEAIIFFFKFYLKARKRGRHRENEILPIIGSLLKWSLWLGQITARS